jgi:hypothetical protein
MASKISQLNEGGMCLSKILVKVIIFQSGRSAQQIYIEKSY